MTKTEFISKVSESIGADTAQAACVVNAVLDAITDVVASGDSLAIPGFGTFGTVKRPERTVRNPQNGEPVTVPEHIAPVFKAGKRFRDAVKS